MKLDFIKLNYRFRKNWNHILHNSLLKTKQMAKNENINKIKFNLRINLIHFSKVSFYYLSVVEYCWQPLEMNCIFHRTLSPRPYNPASWQMVLAFPRFNASVGWEKIHCNYTLATWPMIKYVHCADSRGSEIKLP